MYHIHAITPGELSQSQGQVRTKRELSNNISRRVDVKYYLHTRGNEGNPTELEDPDGTPDVSGTPFRSSRQTKFIIHGFQSSGKEQWILNMANALLQAEDVNVFAVDWHKGASPWTLRPYRAATKNCRTVGQTVGKFVHQLGQPANMTHIIGHSLGAHAAGFAGKAAKSRGLTVARISGLDPAGPRFGDVPAEDRLDRGDATFVDVIHTDTAKIGFGKLKPIGHVDFYPNEGWAQPGCGLQLPGCSHRRAHEFYTESINSGCRFLTHRCRDWENFNWKRGQCDSCSLGLSDGACSVMGYPAINYPNSHGSMYLVTNDNPEPHCAHRGRVKREAGSGESTQCVQSLRTDMRQEIWDYMDSITDIQEMGMYSEMDVVVANITADEPNCGPEDTPIIMEYIGDGKYDSIMAWAKDKCPGSMRTSGGASTLPSALLVFALQFTAVVAVFLCFAKVKFPNRCPAGLLALTENK
ncbi:PREDICTED: pancreatic lipase-related protein 2-like [Branchiostoma belcheri]|uniref:Pancreatic lipase-related protein 2-like n=1 Tax=Branchiostoma belcheri TaxID=7741 RepID=A0A6P4ZT32_BRABE|nr:PREDICTED: pancreatic lipase-related protein 2-like [Branchiostoma belcheri]